MTSAQVVSVTEQIAGDELAVAATAGQTLLTLNDAVDFNEGGGTLQLDDTEGVVAQIAYSAADRVANTLTVGALAASWPIGSQVQPYPLETERIAYLATLDGDDEGELITARVPFNLIDRIPVGERDQAYGEMVELARTDWSYVVADVYGETPVVDGSLIDPTTLPPPVTSDTFPPPTSPTPVLTGMVSGLFVRWVGVTNPDPVTYDVYLSTTTLGTPPASTDLAATTDGTLVVLRVLPADGTALVVGTDYHVKIVARDDDGSAAASADVIGQLAKAGPNDIVAITADQILTADLEAVLTVTGYIGSDDPGAPTRHWEADAAGIRLYDSLGNPVIVLPTSGADPASFQGSVTASDLTVQTSTLLQGIAQLDRSALMSLAAKIADPNVKPVLTQDVETTAFNASSTESAAQRQGLWFDGTNYWYVADVKPTPQLVKVNTSGVELSRTTLASWVDDYIGNVVKIGAYWYGQALNVASNSYWYVWADSAGVPGARTARTLYGTPSGGILEFLTTDGTTLYTASINPSIHPVFKTYTAPGTGAAPGAAATSNTGAPALGNGIFAYYVGSGDLGSLRHIIISGVPAKVWVFNGSFVEQTAEEWTPVGYENGIAYDGANFRTLAATKALNRYTAWQKATAITQPFYAAYSWFDSNATGSTHESALSPAGNITMKQRWRLSMSWPPIPVGGTDDPNEVRLYLKQASVSPGSTFANYFRQPGGPFAGTATKFITYDVSGGTPTRDTAFPGATPAIIQSELGEWKLRGDGRFDRTGVPPRQWEFFEEFTAPLVAGDKTGYVQAFSSGAGPAGWTTAAAPGTNHAGIISGDTGNTNAGMSGIFMHIGALYLATSSMGRMRFGCIIKTPNVLGASGDNYWLWFGIADGTQYSLSTATTRLGMRYSDAVNGATGVSAWQAEINGAVHALSDNGGSVVVTGNTWYLLEFEIAENGTSVTFFINRVQRGRMGPGLTSPDVACTLPAGALRANLQIERRSGTAARALWVDALWGMGEIITNRWT